MSIATALGNFGSHKAVEAYYGSAQRCTSQRKAGAAHGCGDPWVGMGLRESFDSVITMVKCGSGLKPALIGVQYRITCVLEMSTEAKNNHKLVDKK